MSEYRYVVEDIVTREVIGDLEATGVRYLNILGRPGTFSGSVPVAGTDPALLDVGRRAIYVLRDGVVRWGGILWAAPVPLGSDQVQLSAEGWLGYWGHRSIRRDRGYFATEQFQIYRDLVLDAQDVALHGANADLGIDVVWDAPSGVLRADVTSYLASDNPNLGTRLDQLANREGGFDVTMAYAINDDGVITKAIRLGYPYLGRQTGFVFRFVTDPDESPGNVTARGLGRDASAMAWRWISTGAGEGQIKTRGVANDETRRGVYPLLDGESQYPTVLDQPTIDNHARGDLAANGSPALLPQIEVDPDMDPKLGDYEIGDVVRYRCDDGAASFDGPVRITATDVTVSDQFDEKVALTLQGGLT